MLNLDGLHPAHFPLFLHTRTQHMHTHSWEIVRAIVLLLMVTRATLQVSQPGDDALHTS